MLFLDQQKKVLRHYIKKEQSLLVESELFKIRMPNEKVTDSSRSSLGYTFLSYTNFSIDNTQEKYYFNNPNNQASISPCHLIFRGSSFLVVVDPQRDTLS